MDHDLLNLDTRSRKLVVVWGIATGYIGTREQHDPHQRLNDRI
jgi:hypothetical protein